MTRSQESAYQIDRLVESREIIRREVRGRQKGKAHAARHEWRELVDQGLGQPMPEDSEQRELEERARKEKAAAIEQIFRARLSVLIGPAGTGKTTLLRMLCDLPDVASKGILLLAPTGKARVRLEELTGQRGAGRTLAQFLLRYRRYDGDEFGITFVILPNPCWLLSRELLYTALTRHRERLVILHQGPVADFRRFAGEEHSEIARRMTNLFADPFPKEVKVGVERRFLEDRLIHRTERGDLVSSKSELVIANMLHARNIDYLYEQPLVLGDGSIRYPDFTIIDHARGVTFYWEHLGLLDDPEYWSRWERKRRAYSRAGIVSWADGGGENGTLIETRDDPGGALDAATIARLIDQVLLGE